MNTNCEFCGKEMKYEEMVDHACDEHLLYNWLLFKGFEQDCLEDPNIIIVYDSELL